MLRYHLGELEQALAPFARRGVEPHVVICIARRPHGGVDVFFGPLRNLCDDLASGWGEHVLAFASRSSPPLAPDEDLPSLQPRAHFFLPSGARAASPIAEPRMSTRS